MRFVLHFILGISVFFLFVRFSHLEFNTADGSLYLNIAENIANHKGFVFSDNLYQGFNTLYHPLWPYYVPLYPCFISLFINHGGIEKVIQVNILLFALNTVLIFYILQEAIPTFLNVFFTFFLVFSINFFISSMYAWTEQFYFFCFILTFILFLRFSKSRRHLLWLGLANGLLFFIRMSHLYNFLAYLPFLLMGGDSLRRKSERLMSFVGPFILVYGLYQLFCLMKYHVFYPECPQESMSYALSRSTSGIIYDFHKVGIQIPVPSFFSLKNFLYIKDHLQDFLRQMPIFFLASLFYFFIPAQKRKDGGLVVLCFWQSLFTILGYSFTFYCLPSSLFDSLRYSMIPFVLMGLSGWYCMYQGLSLSESVGKRLVGFVVLFYLLYPQFQKFVEFRDYSFSHPLWERPYYKDLFGSFQWIDKNLPQEVLVASDEDQESYFMHRPFISTPRGASLTCTNLFLYNRIYAPDYYVLSFKMPNKCFMSIPYTTVFSNNTFTILRVIKTDGKGSPLRS